MSSVLKTSVDTDDNKSVGHVYRDICKDNKLCLTEKKILSLILCMARKNKLFFMRCSTIAKKFNISEKRVKNIITKLGKLKYISRVRKKRIRYISIHKDSVYYRNHNLDYNPSQLSPKIYLSNKDTKFCLHAVDKAVDGKVIRGTSRAVHSFNNIYRKGNIISNSSPSERCFNFNQEACDKEYVNLIMSIATKRKIHLLKEQLQEVTFHVEHSMAKNNLFKTPYLLVNQALTLIQGGVWSTPYKMRLADGRREIENENKHVGQWEKQKSDEIGLYKRSGQIDVSRDLSLKE